MPLRHVHQEGGYGCFVASAAMLTGKDYHETCRVFWPSHIPGDFVRGFSTHTPVATAKENLKKLGCKVKMFRGRNLERLKQTGSNALLIVRHPGDYMCHCVAYDASTNQFMDPMYYSYESMSRANVRYIQRNVESILLVQAPKQITNNHEMEIAA